MRFLSPTLLAILSAALQLYGAQYSGSVRAADQPVPGATITARQGRTKITSFTDENGRFQMNLPPGDWDVQVEMFEFTSASEKVSAGAEPISKEWTLEMPRLDQRTGTTAPAVPASSRGSGGGRRQTRPRAIPKWRRTRWIPTRARRRTNSSRSNTAGIPKRRRASHSDSGSG